MNCTKELWLDIPTRWNSTYMMLERALFYRQAFVNLVRVDKEYKDCPSLEHWEKMVVLAKLLRPFDEITKLFSGSLYPTINLFFENVWKIHLQLLQICSSPDDVLKNMGNVMLLKFKKYWEDYNLVLAFGVILDPRYKVDFVKFCYEKLGGEHSNKWLDIREQLYLMFEEYEKMNGSVSDSTTSTSLGISTELDTDEFDSFHVNLRRSGKSELQLYLEDPLLPRVKEVNGVRVSYVIDVLEWWKKIEYRYPQLSRMARDILSIPITLVASESSFSLGGRVLNKWRTCILSDTLEALMTTCNWLYGYKIEEDEEDIEDEGEVINLI
ncbi:Zinc finger BED domain-containing protein RICESLEEPER 3 [Linum grandiflorum]